MHLGLAKATVDGLRLGGIDPRLGDPGTEQTVP